MMKNIFVRFCKIMSITSVALFIVSINYIFIRPSFPMFDKELRYFDHFLSGLVVSYLIHLYYSEDAKISSISYCVGSLAWEFYQFTSKGYFQLDQLMFDFLGAILFYNIYKKLKFNIYTQYEKNLKRKEKEYVN